MAISPVEFKHLCRLARLAPSEAQSLSFAAQCDDILAYMDKLTGLDTTGIEPLYSLCLHDAPFRDDVPLRRMQREDVLGNAPDANADFFIVPRIVEGK